jgi:hypothetical protein
MVAKANVIPPRLQRERKAWIYPRKKWRLTRAQEALSLKNCFLLKSHTENVCFSAEWRKGEQNKIVCFLRRRKRDIFFTRKKQEDKESLKTKKKITIRFS